MLSVQSNPDAVIGKNEMQEAHGCAHRMTMCLALRDQPRGGPNVARSVRISSGSNLEDRTQVNTKDV